MKGPLDDRYPAGITAGLRLHRRIDSLAHSSAFTRRSRQRLDTKYGHGRGIIVDIFYDHFLAAHWPEQTHQPLEEYAADIYRMLQAHDPLLPPALKTIVPHMIAHNWLVSYRHRQVVGRALQRISQRLSRPLPLDEAVADLAHHEDAFLNDFRGFLKEAQSLAHAHLGD